MIADSVSRAAIVDALMFALRQMVQGCKPGQLIITPDALACTSLAEYTQEVLGPLGIIVDTDAWLYQQAPASLRKKWEKSDRTLVRRAPLILTGLAPTTPEAIAELRKSTIDRAKAETKGGAE